jgi:hypothetical protein
LGTSADGFLWTEVGPAFASFLSFSVKTPADATITNETSGGSTLGSTGASALIFLISGDVVTSVGYSNTYYSTPTFLTTAVGSVLVSVDGEAGKVSTVVPLIASRQPGKIVQKVGNTYVINSKFTGAWDNHGKNLIPGGGQSLKLDAKTGQVVY